jgi:hypothetical protein
MPTRMSDEFASPMPVASRRAAMPAHPFANLTRRAALLALGGTVVGAPRAQDGDAEVYTGFRGTRLRFAGVDAGRAVLAANDAWLAATGEFQWRALMSGADPVSRDAFVQWNADAVRPWPAAQRQRWRRALEALAPAFAALRIPLPEEVLLIATNGQESSNLPYTRAHAVVLPGAASMPGYSDALLLAHELWHVAARHAPALATALYAEIGFEPMPELEFPAEWASVRIANPDAPGNAHAMRLNVAGRTPWVTPVLVASRTELRPGERFFDVMEARLLEVVPGQGGPSRAVRVDGRPRWHAIDRAHDYLQQLGGNTGYVIHYEEAIADNVALLATGIRPRNPALLERIKAALQARP